MCTSYYFDMKHSDNNYDTTAWSEAILLVHKILILALIMVVVVSFNQSALLVANKKGHYIVYTIYM